MFCVLLIIICHSSYRVGGTPLHLVLRDPVGRAVPAGEAVGGGYWRAEGLAGHLHVWPGGHHGDGGGGRRLQLKTTHQSASLYYTRAVKPLSNIQLNGSLKSSKTFLNK